MGTNQYLEWKEWKIGGITRGHINFIEIYFEGGEIYFENDNLPINFSKVFLASKGIKIDEVAVGKTMYVQPKVSGTMLGMHMVNDLKM